MEVAGLDFHRVIWHVISALEAVNHPRMKLLIQQATAVSLKPGLQVFSIRCVGTKSWVIINNRGTVESQQARKELDWTDFELSGNFYLNLRHDDLALPRDIKFSAGQEHLCAKVIYYWFVLSMGELGISAKADLLRNLVEPIRTQMSEWLATVEEFHKYVLLHE